MYGEVGANLQGEQGLLAPRVPVRRRFMRPSEDDSPLRDCDGALAIELGFAKLATECHR